MRSVAVLAALAVATAVAIAALRKGLVATRTGNMTTAQVRLWSGVTVALGIALLLITLLFVED